MTATVHALSHYNKRELLPLLIVGTHLRSEQTLDYSLEYLTLASTPVGGWSGERHVRLLPFYYNDVSAAKNLARSEWAGHIAVNLCWEQIRNDWLRLATRPTGKLVDQGMLFCSWGPNFEKELLASGVPQERIVRTGNPRFDIPRFPNLVLSKATLASMYGLDANKPWLLIPWNLQFAVENSPFLQKVAREYNLPYPTEMERIARGTKDLFLQLIAKLESALPEWEIVFRAHPSDRDSEQIRSVLSHEHKGVHFVSEFDLAYWYMAADFALGWTSTSLIESAAFGIATASFEPIDYTDSQGYDVGRMLQRYQKIDDVISAIRNYKTHPSIVNPELFSAWYGDNDGMAAKRIADLCTQCVKGEIGQPTERKVYRTTIAFHRNWARRVLQRGLRNKGFLGYVGHGRKRKGNFWIPKIMVESVTNGGDVSSYLEFLR